ncbi:DegT/DnrJ/EryC1/StrS aminotransferase family protein [Marinilabilia sp.]|uniref:DegT/DnrJ/EryC1/StrS family aminotransferase n=1 Tax=Marinilabilia sp. TaxID=2021252 RepID=UPI0025BF5143|nr:DegT/DnrJ/EryC1/StrS family aminotransferase [Marinilabilia sp.]
MADIHNKNIQIPMVDLTGQYHRLQPEIDGAMQRVLDLGNYINGAEVKVFSDALAGYLSTGHVIPCGNGTDALQAALMALDLEPGDEVITTTFSFVSTVEVIVLLGLQPVLVDVDPHTYNIDPAKVRNALTERTRVIIPVHLFGQGAAMDEIMEIARELELFVIEDGAQSLGASYQMNGTFQKLGTIGHIGCTSFFPSKNLGCFGDGGACFTHDEYLAERLRMIVNHGSKKKYFNERVGINSRLDTLQAAVLIEKLKHLDDFILRRQKVAELYFDELTNVSELKLPQQSEKAQHTFNQFTVRVRGDLRDGLKDFLAQAGVSSMVYYPVPLHRQPVFAPCCGNNFRLPVSEMLSEEVLSLPMHTEMTEEQQVYIIKNIKKFFKK